MGMPEPGGSPIVTGRVSIGAGIACTGLMLGLWLLLLCALDTLFGGAIFAGAQSKWSPDPIVLLLGVTMSVTSLLGLVIPRLLQAAHGQAFRKPPTKA